MKRLSRSDIRMIIEAQFFDKNPYDLDKEDFDIAADTVIKNNPGVAFTYPREIDSDEIQEDEYENEMYDDYGMPIYKKQHMSPEIIRTDLRRAQLGGVSGENPAKLSRLYHDADEENFLTDPNFVQARHIVDTLAPYEGSHFNPQLSAGISNAKKLQAAYDEIADSREMSNYLTQLAMRMQHDGSASYVDHFDEADEALMDFEAEVHQKYGLTEEEIDRLGDALESKKDAW